MFPEWIGGVLDAEFSQIFYVSGSEFKLKVCSRLQISSSDVFQSMGVNSSSASDAA